MTDEPKPPPPAPAPSDPGGLQFDRVEPSQPEAGAPAAAACAGCQTPLHASYYLAGSAKFCPSCRAAYEKPITGGSRFGRFFRATIFGTGAGLLGAVIHYLVYRWTGWTIGLIAIFIGWGVGVAVRNGSDGRGGWVYQGLAMFLTYAAITGMFVPEIAQMVNAASKQAPVQTERVGDPPETAPAPGTEPPGAAAVEEPKGGCVMGMVALVVLSLAVMAIALAAPFLAIKESFIFLIILGFSLYEAWKINRRVRLEFKGPFELVAPPPEIKGG